METAKLLTGKAKLVYEAVTKIQDGKKLIAEGRLLHDQGTTELESLIGAIHQPTAGKVQKLPASKFKKTKKTIEMLSDDFCELVKRSGPQSSQAFEYKFKLGQRTVDRVLDLLVKSKRMRDIGKGTKGSKHVWNMTSEEIKNTSADIQPLADKALSIISSSDWINNKILLAKLDLTPGAKTSTRLLSYLLDANLAKQIEKRENPAHKGKPVFKAPHMYWVPA